MSLSIIQQQQDTAAVVAIVALWWHYDQQEKRRQRRVKARSRRQQNRLHDRTYNALKEANSSSNNRFPDVSTTMIENLLSYIGSQQKPISESLRECGIDPRTYQDNSLEQILDLAKKNINVFPYSAVKACWFQLYVDASIARSAWFLKNVNAAYKLDDVRNGALLPQIVSTLDNALIIAGGGNEETKATVHEILRRLDQILYSHKNRDSEEYADDEEVEPRPTKKPRLNSDNANNSSSCSHSLPTGLAFVPKVSYPIPRLDQPSLAKFESSIHESNTPVILTNTLAHWPALSKWHDAKYWRRRTLTGLRLVPVEIGQSYTDEGWRQEIMTFERFLEDFISEGDDAEEIGYLAQHDLFSQIPELRADIEVPDYCFADVPASPGRGVELTRETESTSPIETAREESFSNRSTVPSSSKELKRKANQTDTTEADNHHLNAPNEPNKRVRIDQETTTRDLRSTDRGRSKRKADETTHADMMNEDPHVKGNAAKRARINQEETSSPFRDTQQGNGKTSLEPLSSSTYNEDEAQNFTINPSANNRPSPDSSPSPSISPPPTIHQNIWFGTRTVTPLHHDPYSNILTQIHGTKYIRLYSPTCTASLYPRSSKEIAPHIPSSDPVQIDSDTDHNTKPPPTIDMSNTSNIPLWSIEQSPHEDWDELYPGFSSVPYVECLLQEGEALYIPKGWWHYVRGVSAVGIGVSFWW